MRLIEAKFRKLVETHCDTARYAKISIMHELVMAVWSAFWLSATVALHWICISFDESEYYTNRWWCAYACLWFAQQYLEWVTFALLHDRVHATFKGCTERFFRGLQLLQNSINHLVTLWDLQPHFQLGHLHHHQYNGRSSIAEFIREPWFPGKDAEVTFFGIMQKIPTHSDLVPMNLFTGPMTYCLYNAVGVAILHGVLTIGTLLKFPDGKALFVTCHQAVRGAILVWSFKHFPMHAFIYWVLFVVPTAHYSMLAIYSTLTHPLRRARKKDLRGQLEERYGDYYPTQTPTWPDWFHRYIFLNLCYHIEHHCFPKTPWYNLHLVHEDMVKIASDVKKYPQPVDARGAKRKAELEQDVPDKIVSWEELAEHADESSCWICIEDVVLDVTEYLDSHPGGIAAILSNGGKDASADYYAQHTTLSNLIEALRRGGLEKIGRIARPEKVLVDSHQKKIA